MMISARRPIRTFGAARKGNESEIPWRRLGPRRRWTPAVVWLPSAQLRCSHLRLDYSLGGDGWEMRD
jgi:hypothetical protein